MAQQTDPEDALGQFRALLRHHPRLFQDHPELLEELELGPGEEATVVGLEHARGRRLERRIQELEAELGGLVETARENDRLACHLHRLTVELLGCQDGEELIQTLVEGVQTNFQVDAVGLRLAREWFAGDLDEGFLAPQLWIQRRFVTTDTVALGPATDPETVGALYGEVQPPVESHALLPLRQGSQLFGLMGLASQDAQRYAPDRGTTYLERLAELTGALLSRYLRV